MSAPTVLYDVATKRLDDQMQQIDQLDAKAATLYASSSGILAIFAGLLALTTLPTNSLVKALVLIALLLALLAYLVLLGLLYAAYRLGEWSLRPDLADLAANCADHDDDTMHIWVADECVRSIQANEPHIAHKAWYLRGAIVLLPIEAALLVIAGGLSVLAR